MTARRLSVVIPCRNEAGILPRQLSALAAQRWDGEWEVVVADNGSTDATVDVAHAVADGLPALRVVDASTRPGRHHACNVGGAAATGDALLFLDADDEVAPGYLQAMALALTSHDFVAARLDYETLNPEWLRRSRRGGQAAGLQDWHLLPMAAGCSLGIDRAAFIRLGGFDEGMHYAEDVDLCWRAQRSGLELVFVPDAVIRYRFRDRPADIYRQARGYGRGAGVLYRLYDSPVVTPTRKAAGAVQLGRRLLRRLPRARERGTAAQSAWDVGYFVGWVQASIAPWRYCQPTRHGPVAQGRG